MQHIRSTFPISLVFKHTHPTHTLTPYSHIYTYHNRSAVHFLQSKHLIDLSNITTLLLPQVPHPIYHLVLCHMCCKLSPYPCYHTLAVTLCHALTIYSHPYQYTISTYPCHPCCCCWSTLSFSLSPTPTLTLLPSLSLYHPHSHPHSATLRNGLNAWKKDGKEPTTRQKRPMSRLRSMAKMNHSITPSIRGNILVNVAYGRYDNTLSNLATPYIHPDNIHYEHTYQHILVNVAYDRYYY